MKQVLGSFSPATLGPLRQLSYADGELCIMRYRAGQALSKSLFFVASGSVCPSDL